MAFIKSIKFLDAKHEKSWYADKKMSLPTKQHMYVRDYRLHKESEFPQREVIISYHTPNSDVRAVTKAQARPHYHFTFYKSKKRPSCFRMTRCF